MTVAGKVVRSAIINSLSGYGMQVIGLLSGIVLTRLLTTREFGDFGLALAISLFFSRVRLFGFSALLIAQTDPDDLDISTQFWLTLAFGLVTIGLVILALPILGMIYAAPIIRLTLIVTAISVFEGFGIASTPEALIIKDLRFGTLSSLTILSKLLEIGATIAGALAGWGADALLLGFGVRVIVYFAGVWIASPRHPKLMFSWQRAKAFIREGSHFIWSALGSFLAFQYDDLAVGTFVGVAALGLYQRAYALSLVPMSLVGGVLGVAAATYASVKTDRTALSEAVSYMLDAVGLVVMPASVGLAIIAPEFVRIVYTDEFAAAAPMLQLLLLYSMVRPLNDAVGSLAPAVGRNAVVSRYGIIQSVVMVISCTVLTLLWGANGAAISAGLTVCVAFGVFVRKLLRPSVDIDYRAIFAPPLISAGVGAAITLAAARLWLPDSLFGIMLYKAAIFSAAFGLTLIIVGRDAMIQRIRRIYQALTGRAALAVPSAESTQPT